MKRDDMNYDHKNEAERARKEEIEFYAQTARRIVEYGTVLYCTVLYCTVLYCTVLYCTVLYCTVLYCTVLYCTVLYVLSVLYRQIT
jgi:hypothetical protein